MQSLRNNETEEISLFETAQFILQLHLYSNTPRVALKLPYLPNQLKWKKKSLKYHQNLHTKVSQVTFLELQTLSSLHLFILNFCSSFIQTNQEGKIINQLISYENGSNGAFIAYFKRYCATAILLFSWKEYIFPTYSHYTTFF